MCARKVCSGAPRSYPMTQHAPSLSAGVPRLRMRITEQVVSSRGMV